MALLDVAAEVLAPKIGALPEAVLVERVIALSGATDAQARTALGFTTPLAADFTFTADSAAEPLPVGGTVVGDAEIADELTIDRIRWNGTSFRINRSGTAEFDTWAATRGAWTFTVTVAGVDVVLVVNDATINASTIQWTPDAAATAILDTIAAGTAMRVVVSD